MPAPPGNLNALKHGLRSGRLGFPLTRIGGRDHVLYHDALRLRAVVEEILMKRFGAVSAYHAGRLQSLLRIEQGIRLLERALLDKPRPSVEELRTSRAEIVRQGCIRDGILRELCGDALPAGGLDWDAALQPPSGPAVASEAPGAAVGPSCRSDAAEALLEARDVALRTPVKKSVPGALETVPGWLDG